MQKQVQLKIKGMQRDLSVSAFNSEYAYENKNMRIMATDDNTLFSLVNEKGNRKIYDIDNNIAKITGVPIGIADINNIKVIFTTGSLSEEISDIIVNEIDLNDITTQEITFDIQTNFNSIDKIYKIQKQNNNFDICKLYEGNLGFNYNYPIETLTFYENENIQKVYWTDGLNQPRFINIAEEQEKINKWSDQSFNFIPKLKLKENVYIDRNILADGIFPPGVIQYALTYYNIHGQESNIFYTSPLYYISYNNSGASPEDKVSCSFNLTIDNCDTNFDYLRIYSILRTSIDAVPEIRRVIDLKIPEGSTEDSTYNYITYIDNGTAGNIIDPTELLYIGGEEVIFGTLSQKDNTLFLGDIQIKRENIDSNIINSDSFGDLNFFSESSECYPNYIIRSGYYIYNNQLKYNSSDITTFKYLEWYRFGVQFQYYTGRWSEPIWITDKKNTITPTYGNKTYARCTLSEHIQDIINLGYIKVRPIVVYPTINDRESICQGILCPTVYNIEDRASNSPFVQSSWFFRPTPPFDIERDFNKFDRIVPEGIQPTSDSAYSKGAIISKNTDGIFKDSSKSLVNKGTVIEFRHGYPIPCSDREAEIQYNYHAITGEGHGTTGRFPDIFEVINQFVINNPEGFNVDQNIITFHSPDIEFDSNVRSLDLSHLKLRLIGIVPFTAFNSDVDIQASAPLSEKPSAGFYKESIGVENSYINGYATDSSYGYRTSSANAYWFDEILERDDDSNFFKEDALYGFMVYPWQQTGSLNNTTIGIDGYKSAILSHKKLSNLKFSFYSIYFPYNNENSIYKFEGISGLSIFDSNEVVPVKMQINDDTSIVYYGNIDKIIKPISPVHKRATTMPASSTDETMLPFSAHTLFKENSWPIGEDDSSQFESTAPIRMKYKSTPHAVLCLGRRNYKDLLLPVLNEPNSVISINKYDHELGTNRRFFWDTDQKDRTINGSVQDAIPTPHNVLNLYGWLWLGELYNDNITTTTRFGGQTPEAFENNLWLPCGEAVSLIDEMGNAKTSVNIYWTEGDTYYQRYDHLKTYPFTMEDENSIVEIASFMCETRVNIDGRYDDNRGQKNNLVMNPTIFNKLNDVYSQKNNFFTYRILNPCVSKLNTFRNSITWTKTKTAGEIIDTWTNITLASILNLDGDKGRVRALRRFNDNLIAFQDQGISQILYNENMQISSTAGVPIEIANSGKVNGKRYLSDKLGCINKWSICETPNGIYFIDDTVKGIFQFNGQFNNLSDKLGFHSWINAKSSENIWNPIDFSNFVTYYDKINGDVLFIDSQDCLAFSEPLSQFTSFYSYEHTPYFFNLSNSFYSLHEEENDDEYKIWEQNSGEYNYFFGKFKPFYTTVIINPDMSMDKIFNNLEFRSDSWNSDDVLLSNNTFDKLTVWNEYQNGSIDLNNISNHPSPLKKKFRIWHANMPRDNSNNRDRIRNPWIYLKLSKEISNNYKTILHDMIIHYFE